MAVLTPAVLPTEIKIICFLFVPINANIPIPIGINTIITGSAANLKELISQTITSWAQESHIQDPELVRVMFSLLRRQYDGIGELLRAMKKTYTISAASVQDAINLLASLGQIRSLLSVRMGKEEEKLMIDGLG